MDKNHKFFCSFYNFNYNVYFLLLMLIIFKAELTTATTTTFLRKFTEKIPDTLSDNPIETAFMQMNKDNTMSESEAETNKYNTYPLEMGEEKYYAKGNCTVSNCHDPYGRCENQNVCACNYGYAQMPSLKASKNQLSCTVSLKSQALFFGLELLTWIGVGHIYAGRMMYGFVKMSVFLFIISIDCILKRLSFNRVFPAKSKSSIVIFSYFIYAFFLLWQTIDIIVIGSNLFRDGNGFKIMTWDK